MVGDGGLGREGGVREEALGLGLQTNPFAFGFMLGQEAVATRLKAPLYTFIEKYTSSSKTPLY